MKKLNNDQQQYGLVSPETIPSVIITASQDPQRVGVTNYRAYMPSALEDYQPLVPLLDTLYAAGSQDTVSIVLNGDGGYVTTASHLSSAIARSQAAVITEAYGRASSAHTLTMLCGDVILPVRNTIIMSHNMSMGSVGSGEEPIKHVQASLDWCYALFEEYQLPFLSKEEISQIFSTNATIWLPDEQDINNRIFTTMWARAVIGALKEEAYGVWIQFVQAGAYENCELVHIDTVKEMVLSVDMEDEEAEHIYAVMAKHGLFGEYDNPLDYLQSLE